MKRILAVPAILFGVLWLLGWLIWSVQSGIKILNSEECNYVERLVLHDLTIGHVIGACVSVFLGLALLGWGLDQWSCRRPSTPNTVSAVHEGSKSYSKKCAEVAFVVSTVIFVLYLVPRWAFTNITQVSQFVSDPLGVLFNLHTVGPVGMDDTGRWHLCRRFDDELCAGESNIRCECEGDHNEIMVFTVQPNLEDRHAMKIADTMRSQMMLGYEDFVAALGDIVLTGDKWGWKPDDVVAGGDVAQKLRSIGARTIADFFAACGFHGVELRDTEGDEVYLEVKLSGERIGNNPVGVTVGSEPRQVLQE